MEKKLAAKYVSWEEVKRKLEKRDPWYAELYYFFRYRFFPNFSDYWRRFKGFLYRGKNGYARYDLWSFDAYLSKVIGKGIKELAKNVYGCPISFCNGEDDSDCHKKWVDTLNKIGDGFLNYYEKENAVEGTNDEDIEKLKESLELFKIHFRSLWD